MDRRRALSGALLFGLVLVAGSPQRVVGDGGEYLMMAANFAEGHRPSIGRQALPVLQERLARFDPAMASWDIAASSVPGRDGRRDFLHFWFYPLIVAPVTWLANLTGVAPTYPFAIVNLLLLCGALWIALPRIGPWASLLIFAGPILWWIDKAHTEAFTFALLTVAFVTWRDRPWWAIIAAAAASTQNPPIAAVAVLMGVAALVADPARWRSVPFLAGAAVGGALAALHPVYTFVRHGTPSLLLRATHEGLPTIGEFLAVPLDLQIGLVPNFPAFALAVLLAAIIVGLRQPRRLATLELGVSAVSATFLLYSFAQTTNVHHGATPSLSRYGLWLIPAAMPLFDAASDAFGATWEKALRPIACVSALVCLFVFHPRIEQYRYAPTIWARLAWTHHPTWTNPLPEIFGGVNLDHETPWTPVATPGCEKVLLGARDTGAWPIPCYPAEVPAHCATAAACYANQTGAGYEFARAPRARDQVVEARPGGVWPPALEPSLRAVLTRWQWWTFRPEPAGVSILRATKGVRAATLVGDGRVILVLADIQPGASLTFRPDRALTATLVDAASTAVLSTQPWTGPVGDPWTVSLPEQASMQLMLIEFDPVPQARH